MHMLSSWDPVWLGRSDDWQELPEVVKTEEAELVEAAGAVAAFQPSASQPHAQPFATPWLLLGRSVKLVTLYETHPKTCTRFA